MDSSRFGTEQGNKGTVFFSKKHTDNCHWLDGASGEKLSSMRAVLAGRGAVGRPTPDRGAV